MRHAVVLALLSALVMAVAPAKADPTAVRETITAQLDAFRDNDAARAFSYAAPSIKSMFGTPERFIAMVRRGYKPVYDANNPTFLRARQSSDGTYAQEVGLVDDDGKAWTALYTLQKQPDGAWRITGCYLREGEDQAV